MQKRPYHYYFFIKNKRIPSYKYEKTIYSTYEKLEDELLGDLWFFINGINTRKLRLLDLKDMEYGYEKLK